jgi:hypothetical protein
MKRDIETEEKQELYRIPPSDNTTLALPIEGKRLALMMRGDETTRGLKVLHVEGGEPAALHSFEKDLQVKYIDITWSPDGSRITFSSRTMHENVSAVWVMENFLPKQK